MVYGKIFFVNALVFFLFLLWMQQELVFFLSLAFLLGDLFTDLFLV